MDVINLINSVGFPMTCTIVLFFLYNKTITSFKETIDNNTKVTEKVYELIKQLTDRKE